MGGCQNRHNAVDSSERESEREALTWWLQRPIMLYVSLKSVLRAESSGMCLEPEGTISFYIQLFL